MNARSTLLSLVVGGFLVAGAASLASAPADHVTRISLWHWQPDAGYSWTSDRHNETRWTPGLQHPKFAHLEAGSEPGKWSIDAGYAPTTPGVVSAVVWTPGLDHPTLPHVKAAVQEGKWDAEFGYRFVSSEPGDLRVARIESPPSSAIGTDPGVRCAVDLIGAVAGHVFSRPSDDDGAFAKLLGRPLAEQLRDASIRDCLGMFASR